MLPCPTNLLREALGHKEDLAVVATGVEIKDGVRPNGCFDMRFQQKSCGAAPKCEP